MATTIKELIVCVFQRKTETLSFSEFHERMEALSLNQFQQLTRKNSLKNTLKTGITQEQRDENATLQHNIAKMRDLAVLVY